jgi:hypothetical protein
LTAPVIVAGGGEADQGRFGRKPQGRETVNSPPFQMCLTGTSADPSTGF